MHLAGILVTEQSGGLIESHWQIAVGAGTIEVNLILEWAGHWTQCEAFLGFIMWVAQNEHAIQIVIPVTADLVQFTFCHIRSFGQLVAPVCFSILDPTLELLDYLCTVWQNNRQALTDNIYCGKVFQFTADLVVVAAECFFLLFEVCFQLTCFRESDTIHTAHGVAAGIASPVCTGCLCQFDCFDGTGAHQMRTSTKISKVTLCIDAQLPAFFSILFQEFQFVILTCENSAAFFHGDDSFFYRDIFFDDLFHFSFDSSKLVWSKWFYTADIVVPAVFQSRTDAEFCFWIQMLDSLCHNMSSSVPECFFAVFIIEGADFQVAVFIDWGSQVNNLIIDSSCTGSFCKACTQTFCDINDGYACFKFFDAAVF